MTAIVVVGMEAEAEIIRQISPKAIIVIGAGDATLLSQRLNAALEQNAILVDHVISVGICGGISTNSEIGNGAVMVGVSAQYELACVKCDMAWANCIYAALKVGTSQLSVEYASFAYSTTAIARLTDKMALRASTGADVVDEETFIAGSIAVAKGLSFAALRAVSDAADFELPPAALIRLAAEGRDNIGAILASIAGDPWQIPELVGLGVNTAYALKNLKIALGRIGPDFAYSSA